MYSITARVDSSSVERRKKMLRVIKNTETGRSLRLREGVYRQLQDREWVFNRAENEMIFLVHPSGAYGVVVRPQDIDWNEC
jgi:hypothetical protein